MKSPVYGVRGAGGHGPQAGLGRYESDFPSEPAVPEGRTAYGLVARSHESRSHANILKWIRIGYRSCKRDFDNLPLLAPVIRSQSGRGAENHMAWRQSDGYD